jgi:hypothetical protein
MTTIPRGLIIILAATAAWGVAIGLGYAFGAGIGTIYMAVVS